MGFQFSPLPCLVAEKESRKPIESGNTQVHKQQPKKPKKFLHLLSFDSSATKQSDKPSKLTKQIVMITYRDCMMFWPLQ